ncbi:7TM-DISM domain-containing protein [Clostridium lacusfryxellense]|uniref:7TM-DISM domain-containing protein n=1 Tax=Clostridium lacusfryxellense TaxID=205328 RepID=UPI001C0DC620|nr:7TM-DISM domain-containing protein [Clostridium lacusfryxellense]MBU3114367.1 7TM-DISM domain-containing protein [Clostridium lacusfryxellense]
MAEIKSHKIKISILLLLTLIAFILIIKASSEVSHTQKEVPLATKGVLDLRDWDFKVDGIIKLNGGWEFYNNELLLPEELKSVPVVSARNDQAPVYDHIPGIFGQQGYCTYRLKLLMDNKDELYSVKIDFIQNAYELWADNKLITSVGQVGKSRNEMVPQKVPSIGSFYVENGETYLVLRVSNFYNKYGYIDTLILGESKDIMAIREKKLALSLFIIGCTMMAAIYSFGVFINRRKEKAQLYFAIICIIIAVRTIFIGEGFIISLLPHLDYIFSTKIKIWTFYGYMPFIVLFIHNSYEQIMSSKFVEMSNYLAGAYTLIVMFVPIEYYLFYIPPFELFALVSLFNMMYKICIVYIQKGKTGYIVVVGRDLKRHFIKKLKVDTVYIVVVGLFALFITRINDILYEYSIIITNSFAPLGILIFIIVNYYLFRGL